MREYRVEKIKWRDSNRLLRVREIISEEELFVFLLETKWNEINIEIADIVDGNLFVHSVSEIKKVEENFYLKQPIENSTLVELVAKISEIKDDFTIVVQFDAEREGVRIEVKTDSKLQKGDIVYIKGELSLDLRTKEEIEKNLLKKPLQSFDIRKGVFLVFFLAVLLALMSTALFLYASFDIGDVEAYFFLFLFNYFVFRATWIGMIYFLSEEECWFENGYFYYQKKLFLSKIRSIVIPISEIQKITSKPKKVLKKFYKDWITVYYLYYFRKHERILITLYSGKVYKIWNFVEKASHTSVWDSSEDSDERFLRTYRGILCAWEEEKEKEWNRKQLNKWEEIYKGDVKFRYSKVLEEIYLSKTLFYVEGEKFVVNASSLAIEHLLPLKNMNLKKIDFYEFYIRCLSPPSLENTLVEVGYNGVDSEQVTMKQLKEDLNRLRDTE